MKTVLIAALVALLGVAAVPAIAKDKVHNNPGHNRTCLVTSGNPGSFNDVDVTGTKWLPSKAAEKQAAKDPDTMRTFDYTNDPLVTGGTYSSAEELCKEHFD